MSVSAAFARHAATGFAIGVGGAAVIECALVVSSNQAESISRAMLQSAIARGLLYGTPLAMLPALWYARTRDRLSAPGHGLMAGAAGIVITLVVAGWIAPIGMRAYSLQTIERARRSAEDSAKARRSNGFTLSRAPQRRPRVPALGPLTPREAVAADPAAKTWPDLIRAGREDPARARSYRLESRHRAEVAALAGVLGFLGWTLGSLQRNHALHPVMWWGMIWLITLVTAGSRVGTSLVVFGVAAMTLSMLSQPSPARTSR